MLKLPVVLESCELLNPAIVSCTLSPAANSDVNALVILILFSPPTVSCVQLQVEVEEVESMQLHEKVDELKVTWLG